MQSSSSWDSWQDAWWQCEICEYYNRIQKGKCHRCGAKKSYAMAHKKSAKLEPPSSVPAVRQKLDAVTTAVAQRAPVPAPATLDA